MYYKNYERLKEERGVSDYKVSDETGVSRSTLSEWKTGAHTPNTENLKKIAAFFETSLDELCKEEKEG